MKKIISLFERDYTGDRRVVNRIVPGAEWVARGEGVATRKLDGTACLVKGGELFRRYDAKHGKTPPPDFLPAQPEPDAVTGHWPGWVPVGDGPADKVHRETFLAGGGEFGFPDGTYELCGPKVAGNPERLPQHQLIPHGREVLTDCPRSFDGLRQYFASHNIEGVVWWRDPSDPDCDKVKIKAKDFGIKRRTPPEEGK